MVVVVALQKLVSLTPVIIVILAFIVPVILNAGAATIVKLVLIDVILMTKLTVWQQNTKTKMSDVKLVEHAMGVSTAMQNAISGMD